MAPIRTMDSARTLPRLEHLSLHVEKEQEQLPSIRELLLGPDPERRSSMASTVSISSNGTSASDTSSGAITNVDEPVEMMLFTSCSHCVPCAEGRYDMCLAPTANPLPSAPPPYGRDHARQSAKRRLDLIYGHLPYHPYATPPRSPVPHTHSTQVVEPTSTIKAEHDTMYLRGPLHGKKPSPKARREAGNRKLQAEAQSDLNNLMLAINPNLPTLAASRVQGKVGWIPLRKNNQNSKKIKKPLAYNKLNIFHTGAVMLDQYRQTVEAVADHYRKIGGHEAADRLESSLQHIGEVGWKRPQFPQSLRPRL